MIDSIQQVRQPQPAPRRLRMATAIAVVVAGALFVTTVLPAEFGIDPTGIGGVLGLTAMGKLKQGDAGSVRPNRGASPQRWRFTLVSGAQAQPFQFAQAGRNDEVKVTLKPGDTAEVKAFMKVGDELSYSWRTDGGKLNFDFHGEPLNAPSNVFTSYRKGSADKAEGTFKPTFDGTHGWFWRNRTSQAITVTVSTQGRYEKLERVK